MKIVLSLMLLLAFHNLNAQDFLHFKTGEVKEVKIFYLSVEKDLLGYVVDGKKTYQLISSLKKYELNSLLTPEKLVIENNSTTESPGAEEFTNDRVKYDFGKWSISTDLWGLRPNSEAPNMTIEPEYEVNPNFSVRFPLRIGLLANSDTELDYSTSESFWGSYIPNEPPSKFNFYDFAGANKRLLMEIGVVTKYYPYEKSYKWFSPYIAASLKAGLWRGNTKDEFLILDTVANFSGELRWEEVDSKVEFRRFMTPFVSTELLFGVDIIIGRIVNVTAEGGFDLNLAHSTMTAGTTHIRYFGEDYAQVGSRNGELDKRLNTRLRLLLTYRFNGRVRGESGSE